MKYLCNKFCQVRINDVITPCEVNTVYELNKELGDGHACFTSLNAHPLNYTEASEAELLERQDEIDVKEASKQMKEEYGKGLTPGKNPVDQIIDIRYRNTRITEDEKILKASKKQKNLKGRAKV